MKISICLLLLTVFRILPGLSQQRDSIKLFYSINEYRLSKTNKSKIDSVVSLLDVKKRLIVLGFADYLGTNKVNYLLSCQRAKNVRQYLLNSNADLSISAEGKGQIETFKKKNDGEPLNRRVDIIYYIDADQSSFENRIDSLSNLPVGAGIALDELTFEPGSHHLTPESFAYLKKLTQYLKINKNLSFEIQGHICCDYQHADGLDFDTGAYNLSINRAKEIYEYLLKNGIGSNRMKYTGVGNSQPKVYPELTPKDEWLNRRVNILITEK
jgi:outer membrane protein OmpA-like peptidoglycan-associated protein